MTIGLCMCCNNQAQPLPTKRSLGEIPTPQFVVVDSYERDYLRTFAQPSSYVRGRGRMHSYLFPLKFLFCFSISIDGIWLVFMCFSTARSDNTESVEYDLDNDWLKLLNTEEHVLSPERYANWFVSLRSICKNGNWVTLPCSIVDIFLARHKCYHHRIHYSHLDHIKIAFMLQLLIGRV